MKQRLLSCPVQRDENGSKWNGGMANCRANAYLEATDEGNSTTDSERFVRHMKCSQSPGLRKCKAINFRPNKLN